MARANILDRLYTKKKPFDEFIFDSLSIPPMRNYIPQSEINKLHKLVSSIRYSSNLRYKTKEIDKIMRNLGFRRYHSGTNRVVYSYLEDTRFLAKIALDRVGLKDNPLEYKNQFFLKPFVTKVFEVSKCGTVALVERVEPITSIDEFKSMSNEIYDFLLDKVLGEYVVEDVGCEYFMNWGIRKNFGPVLLDYTYVYKLDGNKLVCKNKNPDTGEYCNGIIDYDDGFNNLVCEKCGKKYFAQDLEDKSQYKRLELIKEEERIVDMKFSVNRGNKVLFVVDSTEESKNIMDKNKKVNTKSFNDMFEIVRDGRTPEVDLETGDYITSIAPSNIISNHILSDEEVMQIKKQEKNMDIRNLDFNDCMNMIITDMSDEGEVYVNNNQNTDKVYVNNTDDIERQDTGKKEYNDKNEYLSRLQERIENITNIAITAQQEQDTDLLTDIKSELDEIKQEVKEGLSDIKGKIVNTVNEIKDSNSEVSIGNILKDKLLNNNTEEDEESEVEEESEVTIGNILKDKLLSNMEEVEDNTEDMKEGDVEEVKYERVTLETLRKHLGKDEELKAPFDEEVLASMVTESIDDYEQPSIDNTQVIETVDVDNVETVDEDSNVEEESIQLEEVSEDSSEDYINKDTIAKLFEDDTYDDKENETVTEDKNTKHEKKKGKYNSKNYTVDDNKFYSNFTGGKKGNNKKNIFRKY